MELQKFAFVLIGFCILILIWRLVIIDIWGVYAGFIQGNTLYSYSYHATETRIDLMLYGAILALAFNPAYHLRQNKYTDPNHWFNKNWLVLLILGISMGTLLFSLLYRDPEFRETYRYSLQGLALIPFFYFAIIRSDWIYFKVLNWTPIVYLGRISYTFYLSHSVCIDIVQKYLGNNKLTVSLASFVLTFGFCALMYHFIEKPFAVLRKRLHN
jgi:peptidoglycan/LPS O-acetylase OafA/YrhL